MPGALILRPPVLHGAAAKANMARLAQAARLPLPLPFAGLEGRRSILSDENIVSAVAFLLAGAPASGGTFHLADGPPLTVAAMIAAMREALGRQPGLFALPLAGPMLKGTAPGLARQLTEDLVVDDGALRALGWSPAEASPAGLARMVLGPGQTRL